MVTVRVDDHLTLDVGTADDPAYRVDVVYDDETVTTYRTNSPPWSPPARLAIGNVVAKRLDGYDRAAARDAVGAAIEERRADLEALAD